MDYNVLNRTTNKEDRALLMKFMELPPQKLLMFSSAILAAYISTFSDDKSKQLLLETVVNSITKEVYKESIVVQCSFCKEEFYMRKGKKKEKNPICPKCTFPDLGIEKGI